MTHTLSVPGTFLCDSQIHTLPQLNLQNSHELEVTGKILKGEFDVAPSAEERVIPVHVAGGASVGSTSVAEATTYWFPALIHTHQAPTGRKPSIHENNGSTTLHTYIWPCSMA